MKEDGNITHMQNSRSLEKSIHTVLSTLLPLVTLEDPAMHEAAYTGEQLNNRVTGPLLPWRPRVTVL